DLLQVERGAAEAERGGARNHLDARDARNGVQDLLAEALAERALGAPFAQVDEGKDRKGFLGRCGGHLAGEAIAALGDGLDGVVAELLAKLEDELGEIALLDDRVRPERLDQPASCGFSRWSSAPAGGGDTVFPADKKRT